jgi:hypothetical protein
LDDVSNNININENKNNNSDNKVIPSIETNLDESKNNNLMNNNDSSCKSSVEIDENLKLLTIGDLFMDILKKINKKSEFYNKKLFRQFSAQMMSKYTFDRKELWNTNEYMLYRETKINRQMYDWALENISL